MSAPPPRPATSTASAQAAKKKCASCQLSFAEQHFASKQWKAAGSKRSCRQCTFAKQEHECNQIQTDQDPGMRALQCTICRNPGRFTCRWCHAHYCTTKCLLQHMDANSTCVLLRFKPTKSFPEVNRIEQGDTQILLEINQLITALIKSNLIAPKDARQYHPNFLPEHLDIIRQISQTDVSFPWWFPKQEPLQRLILAFERFSNWVALLENLAALHPIPNIDLNSEPTKEGVFTLIEFLANVTTMRDIAHTPFRQHIVKNVWVKHARFFHKIVFHWIYLVRNSSAAFAYMLIKNSFLMYHEMTEVNDKYGILLDVCAAPEEPFCRGIAYFSRKIRKGGIEEEYLTPLALMAGEARSDILPERIHSFAAAVRDSESDDNGGGISCVLVQKGKVILEPGIVVFGPDVPPCSLPPLYRTQSMDSAVCFLYSGYCDDPTLMPQPQSFRQSPLVAAQSNHELLNFVSDVSRNLPGSDPEVVQQVALANRRHPDNRAFVFEAMRRNLSDDWPTGNQMSFIPFPSSTSPMEQSIFEILLLQDLVEDAERQQGFASSASETKQQVEAVAAVLDALVTQNVASASELLAARRREMERWIEEAREVQEAVPKRASADGSTSTSLQARALRHEMEADSPSSTSSQTAWPEWLRDCKGFDEIISKGAVKFEKVRKFVRSVCRDSLLADRLISTNQVGSHVNIHVRGENSSTGMTVVEQHTGGRKDRGVSLVQRTHLLKHIIDKVTSMKSDHA